MVHCICTSKQKLSIVLCCLRLEKGSVSSGTRSNQSKQGWPTHTMCQSRIDEALEPIPLPQTQCPEPDEVYLAIFTSSAFIGFYCCGGCCFSMVHKDFKSWFFFSAGEYALSNSCVKLSQNFLTGNIWTENAFWKTFK